MREEKSKFMRWSLQMQEFNYNVEHVRGTENHLADALSRTPHGPAVDEESIADLPSYTTLSAINNVTTSIEAIIKSTQDADSAIQTIMQQMQAGSLANSWKVIDNYLYRDTTKGPKLLVPTSAVSDVLLYFHNDTLASHPGILETICATWNGFYWPTLGADATEHVRTCELCQCHKTGAVPDKAALHLHCPTKPFEILNADLMGPYPQTRSGFTHIFTLENAFTRWLEAYPLRNTKTKDLIPVSYTHLTLPTIYSV